MTIAAGTRFGPYEIADQVGAGGMGEVYRATDTRLDRTVAIKVLPEHLADRAELRERFEREAKAVSSLNHPHICTLHDIGEQDGIHYLVMEYVDGETLQQRLEKGRLPLDQALEYAIQIADALDKAHRQGVVHRDLKPGNIMITKSGTKLLDFGLAKLKGDAAEVSPLSQRPTQDAPAPLTAEGTILGTFQYMAPEQLEGKKADARTDIFAFGALVYEMVTGKKAFEGASQASLIGAIMNHQPAPVTEVQPLSPPMLDHVITACLAKSPDDRCQSAADLMRELKWISTTPASGEREESPGASVATARSRLGWVAALLLALGIGGFAAWTLKPSQARATLRIKMDLGERLAGLGWNGGVFDLSPDGGMLAFVASGQLHVKPLDGFESEPIPGTEGAFGPFFSADGRSVGFQVGGDLKSVPIDGGNVRTICGCETTIFFGVNWGADDTVVFSGSNTPLLKVSAGGGVPEPLTTLDSSNGEVAHREPHLLPGGKAVLFTVWKDPYGDQQIVVQALETGIRKVLVEGGSQPTYVSTGHLIYAQGGTLMAVPFDLDRLEVSGRTATVIDDTVVPRYGAYPTYALSSTAGTLVYIANTPELYESSLVWWDRDGNREPLEAFPPKEYEQPSLSPDGERIAVGIQADGHQGPIWVLNIPDGSESRLTYEGPGGAAGLALWSRDGEWVTFNSRRGSVAYPDIFRVRSDGSGQEERLFRHEDIYSVPESYSPDGILAFHEGTEDRNIYTLRPGEDPEPLVATPARETAAMFSPDGNWVAFVSDESGQAEVWVTPFPAERGSPQQMTKEGGYAPVWSPNGDELFYRNTDKLMVIEVTTEPSLQAGNSKELFTAPLTLYSETITQADYDIHPDGQKFLMLESAAEVTSLNVILNWGEELKERVPVR